MGGLLFPVVAALVNSLNLIMVFSLFPLASQAESVRFQGGITESDGWLMGQDLGARIERCFESDWREPVQVVVLGRVKAGRDRRKRADRSLGCVAEAVLEILANIAWPFMVLWEFVTVPKRRRKPVAVPSGRSARAGVRGGLDVEGAKRRDSRGAWRGAGRVGRDGGRRTGGGVAGDCAVESFACLFVLGRRLDVDARTAVIFSGSILRFR